MDTGNDNDVWEIGYHLHVTCHRSRHYGRFAVVTGVQPTRLLIVFDDGRQSEFVDCDSVSPAPPLRVRHRPSRYPQAQRGDNVENQAVYNASIPEPVNSAAQPGPVRINAPLPAPVDNAAQPGRVRITVQSNTPRRGPIRVVIDSIETTDDDNVLNEFSRTLERLVFTVAALIYSNSDSQENNDRVLDDFETAVRGNIRERSRFRQNEANP
jgi:hypothetical protein